MRERLLIAISAIFLVLMAGCTTFREIVERQTTPGDILDDFIITKELKSRLDADPALRGKVTVETTRRIAYLTGTVENDEQKQRATRISLNTPRVTSVANNLQVRSEP